VVRLGWWGVRGGRGVKGRGAERVFISACTMCCWWAVQLTDTVLMETGMVNQNNTAVAYTQCTVRGSFKVQSQKHSGSFCR
jgi:hypothetical protein